MIERCVDASVIVKLALKGEPHRVKARRLVREPTAQGIDLIAPPFFTSKLDTAVRKRVYDGRLSQAAAQSAYAVLDRAPRIQGTAQFRGTVYTIEGKESLITYTVPRFHRLPQAGNHKIIITAYTEDPDYRDVYKPVATVEIPVFLNGYDIVRAKGNFVGYYLEVTDGMFFPSK